jgi:hypothetical protein
MLKKYTSTLFTTSVLAISGNAMASYYSATSPAKYQIYETGYQHTMPLHEKLNQRQGELFFKNTGLFIGASDAIYQERVESEDQAEVDAYAGIKKKHGLFGYHFGVKTYNSSMHKHIEFQEYFVGANIKNVSFSYASNDEGEYTQLNLSHAISNFTLGLHLGETIHLLGEKYRDWSLYASKAFKSITFNAIMTNSEDPVIKGTEFNLGLEKSFKWF